ncbi:hypothetical protein F1D05_31870 [Kribbella qitaiheensis]|uniref:WD40 repeat domain-containing protein n=1 Tax=Kribbella qitaiheensis TaxID=1544730 RepID=A0A7G6X615_9ACTN|nr:hypothetical protein [Kribbella qitaiheensis]QNE21680.1 hypothetical protein F1D05_31870 [Kribbella qitaiheensis]
MLSDGTTKTLHDGKQTVKIDDSLVIGPSGRVAGGWLFIKGEAGGPFQTGTLQADGKFQPLGPQNTRGILKSPDGSKVAVTLAAGKGKTKVLVLDVATRKEIASVTLPHQTTVLWAWNQAGLWFGEDYKVGAQPLLWQPGQGQPVQLTIPGFDLGLEGATDSDKVQVVTRTNKGESWCMKLGSAQGTGFAVDRQYCGSGGRAFYPVVSPDGRTMVHPGSSLSADSRTEVQPQPVVIDVATGKATKLRLPRPISDLPAPVFEDDTHLLFTGTGLRDKQPPKTPPSIGPDGSPVTAGISVIRCDVTSGDCKLVFTTPTGVRIKLGRP